MIYDLNQTTTSEWISRRINAVRSVYTAYQCLCENGLGNDIPDEHTATQIKCPIHGVDNNPSARYYPRSGNRHDHFFCFRCKLNLDSIGLFAKFKGIRFMDALSDLEKRFRVQIPRRPEGPEIVEPTDRGASYVSDKWSDVPRVLVILETKLLRIRDRCSMSDYVKFCRLLDAVSWDYDKAQKATPEMTAALKKTMDKMDDINMTHELQIDEGVET